MFAPRRPSRAAFAVVILSLTGLVACTGQENVSEYGPEAERNFVDEGCTKDRTIEDGEQVVTKLATESFCKCVYVGIRDTYKLSWDELEEYEEQVADADPGELPEPPSQLTKAIDACNTAGPAAPGASDEDATTSTEG